MFCLEFDPQKERGGPKNIEFVCGIQMNAKKISALRLGKMEGQERERKRRRKNKGNKKGSDVIWSVWFSREERKKI